MVKITEELVRKKSEHNESVINSLEELSLHQEDVEKIENLQNWCKDLQILYLQSNLISKIENLNKLKKLEYLNLAVNNVEKIENLERCESLEKLDLTLNFIGDLESVCCLKNNRNLKHLYLTGNPCTDYEGYRDYVVAQLPQLETLDNREITRSERIKAQQRLESVQEVIRSAQKRYAKERNAQKERLEKEGLFELDNETFWKSSSEHAPETRVEISRRARLARGKDESSEDTQKNTKKSASLFAKNGRPLNVNQCKLGFKFNDESPAEYLLELHVYKYLDSSLIEVDLQPIYARITVKGKTFQFVLPEEIYTDKSVAQRSQTTGHLLLRMPRVNYKPKPKTYVDKVDVIKGTIIPKKGKRREYLDVQDSSMDFSKIVQDSRCRKDGHPEVPPLEFA